MRLCLGATLFVVSAFVSNSVADLWRRRCHHVSVSAFSRRRIFCPWEKLGGHEPHTGLVYLSQYCICVLPFVPYRKLQLRCVSTTLKLYLVSVPSEVAVPSVIILNTSNEQYFLPGEPTETMEQLVQFITGVLNGSVQV